MTEGDPEDMMNNIEIIGMDAVIAHILRKTGNQPRPVVKAELAEHDLEVLLHNGMILFDQARKVYEEQLRQNKVQDVVKIEPKKRRNADTASSDIIDLYLYAIGVRLDFPRHLIKNLSVYKENYMAMDEADEAEHVNEEKGTERNVRQDIVRNHEGDGEAHIENNGNETTEENATETTDDTSNENVMAEDDGEPELQPCEGCKKYVDAEIKKCWDYMLNIEKVSNERVSHLERLHQLENIAKKTQPNMQTGVDHKSRPSGYQKSEKEKKPDDTKSKEERPEKENKEHPVKENKENQKEHQKEHRDESRKTEEAKQTGGHTKSENHNKRHVSWSDDADGASSSNAEPQINRRPPRGLFPASNQNRTSSSTVKENGRKFPNKSSKVKRSLTASSQAKSKVVELYLPNISRHPDDTLGEVAEIVREYGKNGGLNIISSRVVRNRFTDNTVGCRITVPERQVDDALGSRMWPSGMKCRRWEKREKSDEYQRSHMSQRRQLNQNQRSKINWREDEDNDEWDGWYQDEENRNERQDDYFESGGYDRDGYDGDGYDGEGYDGYGYNRDGYDRYGYDREGYDRDGYAAQEYDNWEERYTGDNQEHNRN